MMQVTMQERHGRDLTDRRLDDAARIRQIAGDSHAYYIFLSDRLERILVDMNESGASPDDALKSHFSRLLDETRDLLRKEQIKIAR